MLSPDRITCDICSRTILRTPGTFPSSLTNSLVHHLKKHFRSRSTIGEGFASCDDCQRPFRSRPGDHASGLTKALAHHSQVHLRKEPTLMKALMAQRGNMACDRCSFTAPASGPRSNLLFLHWRAHHAIQRPILPPVRSGERVQCDCCEASVTYGGLFQHHLFRHSVSFAEAGSLSLMLEQKRRHKKTIRACDFCSFRSDNKTQLRWHIAKLHWKMRGPTKVTMNCDDCGKTLRTSATTQVWRHWLNRHSTYPEKAKADTMGSDVNLQAKTVQTSKTEQVCDDCGKVDYGAQLFSHILRIHKNSTSARALAEALQQKRKQMILAGKEMVSCDLCPQLMERHRIFKHSLTWHWALFAASAGGRKLRDAERKLFPAPQPPDSVCELCKRNLTHGNLQTHLASHAEFASWKNPAPDLRCDDCGEAVGGRKALTAHQARVHHLANPVVMPSRPKGQNSRVWATCDDCDQRIRKDDFGKHVRLNHKLPRQQAELQPREMLECDKCGKVIFKYILHKHWLLSHSVHRQAAEDARRKAKLFDAKVTKKSCEECGKEMKHSLMFPHWVREHMGDAANLQTLCSEARRKSRAANKRTYVNCEECARKVNRYGLYRHWLDHCRSGVRETQRGPGDLA